VSLTSPELHRPLNGTAVNADRRPARVSRGETLLAWARDYFFADSRRAIQTWLGLIWLLDGALQFQSFMYGNGFILMLKSTALGQPPWIADSMNWAANTMQSSQAVDNTAFALVQVAIGLGLLHRRAVKLALLASFAWSLFVWWFGEGFGMLFMTMSSPLSGAPGAAVLYPLVGLIAWPGERPGGLLGVRGARLAWGSLWLAMSYLWLSAPGTSPDAISKAINGAPSGMSWLTSIQNSFTTATLGHGLVIGLALAAASAAIGIAVARNWRARAFLALAIVLNIGYWILGQGFGGIFAGGATDLNSGPLFVLLAYALYSLIALPSSRPAAGPQAPLTRKI
jgi:hypothetical protein